MPSGAIRPVSVGILVALIASAFAVVGIPSNASAYTSLTPIFIQGDSMFTPENGVVGGSGTEMDPYVIEGWELTGGYAGIRILDTTKYLVISNVYTHGNGVGIYLDNVTNVAVRESVSSLNFNGWYYWGMYVNNSSKVEISNCTLEMNIRGIYIQSSSDCRVADNFLYSNTNGVLFEDCDDVTLRSNVVDMSGEDSVTITRCTSTAVTFNTISQSLPDSYSRTGILICDSLGVNASDNNLSFCVSAFHVTGSSGVDLLQNVFDNGTMYGFEIYSSSGLTIMGNSLMNITGWAAYVNCSSAVAIVDNEIGSWMYECLSNIMLDWSTDCVVSGNVLGEGTRGIALWGASLEHFASHTITDDNMWFGLPVAYYRDIESLTVTAPMISQLIVANCTDSSLVDVQFPCLSIGLYFVSGVSVVNAALASNFTPCIEALCSDDILIGVSILISDSWGLWLYDCADVQVDSCLVSGGFAAVNVQFSRNITIGESMITGVSLTWETASGDGVHSYHTTNMRVFGNMIAACVHGVMADFPSSLTVDANEIIACDVGVNLNCADDGMARITDNNITLSMWYGILLSSCQGVSVYHNSLSDNVVHAFDDSSGDNSWDDGYPSGGNYWSDYTGVDERRGTAQDIPGPDGIGDTPYEFDYATDRYPMMDPLWMDAPPSAWLTVGSSSAMVGEEFSFDASLSHDREDTLESLQVRWDWDGDMDWDTGWSSEKAVEHSYDTPGDYVVSVEVMDSAGQTDLAEVTVEVLAVDVDEDPPVLVADITGTQGDEGWFVSAVEIAIEATDDGSGVLLTEYRIVGSTEWAEYEDVTEFSEDGIWYLEARSTDLAGNSAEENISFKVDCTAPTTSHGLNGSIVTLDATDATSGVLETWYRVDGGEWTLYEDPFEVTGEGSHTVEYRSVDVAGNDETTKSLQVEVAVTETSPGLDWWMVLLVSVIIIGISIGLIYGMKKKADTSSRMMNRDSVSAVSQMADDNDFRPRTEGAPPGDTPHQPEERK